ncbi:hypothetical protein LPJ77_000522 [Coemansia sp. RSA 2523]|nr:hypothetical protein LPJ58_000958 [Coemansia sp. RSA 1591]KAJ1766784.1 hypothetical protein LPJ69_000736 [Coemansia sp. RSA 1752]KAJ1779184.1 hypothetical protein LPJ54_001127 [Coemansia sp. RSA 1824]KAJ1790085.1 hypothetical protein LPJ62_002111 [Coemansia sp. RSA 2167]KAJ1794181.1 hypothetical protein LPJ67_000919 [Coemansia sp. RSA 1938]KAJ1810899.1 hypothetical protein LPJ77_000522 [Coemansia sp. RSA 2523]KAJ2119960.1 hypothetical protein GGF48_004266 [Coemansia sp. RSA 921]KAJ2139692
MADQKVSKHVDQLTVAVDQIQKTLGPVLTQPLNDLLPKLTPIQRCELEALVAYSIDTLFWIYLKVNGVPPKEHPIMKELQRVQRYIEKINRAKGSDKPEPRAMKVDAGAADRFIRNAIASTK